MNLKTLSIATFNLYNLNLPGLPVYTDRTAGARPSTPSRSRGPRASSTVLPSDVFGFQELWHAGRWPTGWRRRAGGRL